jgi:cysteinyl-tRNA synthetase
MMCLQAHYRSELEFSWEGLGAALTRLMRMVIVMDRWKALQHERHGADWHADSWEYNRKTSEPVARFDGAMSNDLNTADALTAFEECLSLKKIDPDCVLSAVCYMDRVLGLGLEQLSRAELRLRPKDASLSEEEIEDALACRKAARAEKDYATSDTIRDELARKGVEVMDGDPHGWDWKLDE